MIPVIYFHKPDESSSSEPSSALSGAVLAVVQDIAGVLRGAVYSAQAGGLASVDVEVKRDQFPEDVAGEKVTATPETLVDEALESARKKLAEQGLEIEAEQKRVSNRTRSAKLKIRVRKRR